MQKVRLHLKHASRVTAKEWWTPCVPRVGDFVDVIGIRYRVTSVLHKTPLTGIGSSIHLFCLRLQKQPGATAKDIQ